MLYFQFAIVAAVFGGIAWVAAGRGGGIVDAAPDRPDVALPDDRQLAKADIDAARFTVGWRGYRMDEVDQVLDRLATEIDYRDRLIAELTGPGGAGSAPTAYQPVPPSSQPAAQQPEPEVEKRDEPGDAGGVHGGNSLSSWYRRPEPPA